MVNNTGFSTRLKKIIEYYNLSPSSLADSIGVQRSSISHLLSGRNKPSLDFVLKILEKYKEVELYWFLNGKGVFPKKIENDIITTNPPPSLSDDKAKIEKPAKNTYLKEIERIIVFFKDGTYKNYTE